MMLLFTGRTEFLPRDISIDTENIERSRRALGVRKGALPPLLRLGLARRLRRKLVTFGPSGIVIKLETGCRSGVAQLRFAGETADTEANFRLAIGRPGPGMKTSWISRWISRSVGFQATRSLSSPIYRTFAAFPLLVSAQSHRNLHAYLWITQLGLPHFSPALCFPF